ncbi:MAG: hypothetical protein NLN66_04765 [Candidatus Thalassarchaeaceae archaeon]|nr:hypothetical protein [Candidatus Thalassarchaeaceae archaeon]
MASEKNLDDFLIKQNSRIHLSDRKLANLVREAYPIGVPALIMKSSTDRMMDSSGYSFILGTPDELLRNLASWLITNAGNTHKILLKLIDRLWKRHGREDIALAAILLANLDHKGMGTDPWDILEKSIHPVESVDSLLLNIEELLRAKRLPPTEEQMLNWVYGGKIKQHMSLLTVYAATLHGHRFSSELIDIIIAIDIPEGDSILTRIKSKISSLEAQT